MENNSKPYRFWRAVARCPPTLFHVDTFIFMYFEGPNYESWKFSKQSDESWFIQKPGQRHDHWELMYEWPSWFCIEQVDMRGTFIHCNPYYNVPTKNTRRLVLNVDVGNIYKVPKSMHEALFELWIPSMGICPLPSP